MKITSKQYALGLMEAIDGQSGKELDKVLSGFVALLIKNRDFNRLEAILDFFSQAYDKSQGEIGADLVSAFPPTEAIKKLAAEYISKKTGVEKVNWRFKEDKNILGGLVLRYEGRVLDASLRQSLSRLKEKINQ
ncbi:MAG TPA: ATP synthase F1 subunit delta [bacterium]|nr:ATP synthase F1 subunit delta [bacterium]HPT29849.1 ATP synthase F1 subunit delta [bacterium]